MYEEANTTYTHLEAHDHVLQRSRRFFFGGRHLSTCNATELQHVKTSLSLFNSMGS